MEWRILLPTTLVFAGPKLQAAKNGFRPQRSALHWLLPLKGNIEHKNAKASSISCSQIDHNQEIRIVPWAHEFNTALTWIFLTHLRGSRAVFELQLKPRASYFRAARLIHTSDYYSTYKDEQKSWCDCSNLATDSSFVLCISLEAPKDTWTEAWLPSLIGIRG